MNMNIAIEILIIILITSFVSFISWKVKKEYKRYVDFFVKYKRFLSPNCISNWRKYGGPPTIIVYMLGMYLQSPIILYTAVGAFAFFAITDLLDGIVARACGSASKEGAALDAEADKWLNLPMLIGLSIIPIILISLINYNEIIFSPIYIPFIVGLIIFDIIGQKIRGKNSPPEAELVGKTKTFIVFIVIYTMSINGRYTEIYDLFMLEIVNLILIIIATILAGISMSIKTEWYQENFRKQLKECLKILKDQS